MNMLYPVAHCYSTLDFTFIMSVTRHCSQCYLGSLFHRGRKD